jgi:hypothetical protein
MIQVTESNTSLITSKYWTRQNLPVSVQLVMLRPDLVSRVIPPTVTMPATRPPIPKSLERWRVTKVVHEVHREAKLTLLMNEPVCNCLVVRGGCITHNCLSGDGGWELLRRFLQKERVRRSAVPPVVYWYQAGLYDGSKPHTKLTKKDLKTCPVAKLYCWCVPKGLYIQWKVEALSSALEIHTIQY